MSRPTIRRLTLVFLFAAAALFVALGLAGWSINFMPAHFAGVILIGFGVAGLCGVNIWAGGPLDIRNDPEAVRKME